MGKQSLIRACFVITGICVGASVANGVECNRVLKEMRMVQVELSPDEPGMPSQGRSIASVDKNEVPPKSKRIALMKRFLNHEPVESQRVFATAMLNYMFERSEGKPGDLTSAMDLVTGKIKTLNQIAPEHPENAIQKYISKSGPENIEELKALIVYLLKAKNVGADAKKVVAFLSEQVTHGNSQFTILEKNCVAGDPTIERMIASHH